MEISIIIPVYNVENYVLRCLWSVVKQRCSRLQVIIIDDCGNDDSMMIVEDFIRSNAHITWKLVRHSRNKGLSAARNTGLNHARGDYIYFLDSDDELPENCIENFASEAIKRSNVEVLIGSVQAIGFGKKKKALEGRKTKTNLLIKDGEVLKAYNDGRISATAWNKFIKRSVIVEYKLYFKEGILHEDILWSFYLFTKCRSVFICNHDAYIYHANKVSITSTMGYKNFDSYLYILSVLKEEVLMNKIPLREFYENGRFYILVSLVKSNVDFFQKQFFFDSYRKLSFFSRSYEVLFSDTTIKIKIRTLISFLPYQVFRKVLLGFANIKLHLLL
ncbi:glycosyltransferase family 2 protein [Olivibacter sitiensis]|uniref:glycosyltransferase family 2 protein n=1 Tax=Olivibacter sitiensis TaxID=376470 RepID=UPI0003F8ABC7|nr:glycosyltransferase family 2 protein [Olivibacter sitiensis]